MPIPGADASDEDLEVHVCESDHWLVDHRRMRLVRVHVEERAVTFVPKMDELPVSAEHVEACCRVVGFNRQGVKQVVNHDWETAEAEYPVSKRSALDRSDGVLLEAWLVMARNRCC